MQIEKGTATRKITISEKSFNVPTPFSEGHKCTAGEASALNQTLGENVRNNMAKAVKVAVEKGEFDQAKAQAAIDEHVKNYEFGQRRASTVDPVEKEALDIARDLIKDGLRKENVKLSSVSTAEMTKRAREVVTANPKITEVAKKRVAERDEFVAGLLG